jgi:hypothetical protein
MSRSKNSHAKSPDVLHGPKTVRALAAQHRPLFADGDRDAQGPRNVSPRQRAGRHEQELRGEVNTGRFRLAEGRSQHDGADRNSDKTRLAKDAKLHDHGNPHGQLNGGVSRHKG